LTEEWIASETVFDGRLLTVRVDTVKTPGGRETSREVVAHPGAVGILPLTEDNRVILVRQFRYAVGRELLEIPAGTREPEETAEACAHRELEEEVGMRAGQLGLMATFFVSPGWCNEELVIFRAWDLEPSKANLEDDEDLEVVVVGPEEIPQLIAGGQIADAKTLTSLTMYLATLRE
jgi:ADP-ribose pyrophosphatase